MYPDNRLPSTDANVGNLPVLCKEIEKLRKAKESEVNFVLPDIHIEISSSFRATVKTTASKVEPVRDTSEAPAEVVEADTDILNNILRPDRPKKLSFKDLDLENFSAEVCPPAKTVKKRLEKDVEQGVSNIQSSRSSTLDEILNIQLPTGSTLGDVLSNIQFSSRSSLAPVATSKPVSPTCQSTVAPVIEPSQSFQRKEVGRPVLANERDVLKSELPPLSSKSGPSSTLPAAPSQHSEDQQASPVTSYHKLSEELIKVRPNHFTKVNLFKLVPRRKALFGCQVCRRHRINPQKLKTHFLEAHNVNQLFNRTLLRFLSNEKLPSESRRWIIPKSRPKARSKLQVPPIALTDTSVFFETNRETGNCENPFYQRKIKDGSSVQKESKVSVEQPVISLISHPVPEGQPIRSLQSPVPVDQSFKISLVPIEKLLCPAQPPVPGDQPVRVRSTQPLLISLDPPASSAKGAFSKNNNINLKYLKNFSASDPLYMETVQSLHLYLGSHVTFQPSLQLMKCFRLYVDYQLFSRQIGRSFLFPPDR